MEDMINDLKGSIAELQAMAARMQGAIVGEPWVIECCPGLYLVRDGEVYRGGSIMGRVICFSPERIDVAVQHVRDHSGGIFDAARKVYRRDAVQAELKAHLDILPRAEAHAAKAAAA